MHLLVKRLYYYIINALQTYSCHNYTQYTCCFSDNEPKQKQTDHKQRPLLDSPPYVAGAVCFSFVGPVSFFFRSLEF